MLYINRTYILTITTIITTFQQEGAKAPKNMATVNLFDLKNTATYLKSFLFGARDLNASLASISQSSRIDPICLVSDDLTQLPQYQDLLNTSVNLITSYYIRALPFAAGKEGARVNAILSSLNPSRSVNITLESKGADFRLGLPSNDVDVGAVLKYTIESATTYYPDGTSSNDTGKTGKTGAPGKDGKTGAPGKTGKTGKAGARGKSGKKVKDHSIKADLSKVLDSKGTLAVGKTFSVDIPNEKGTGKTAVSIVVQLSALANDPDVMSAMLSIRNFEVKMPERWFKWRAGRINFWEMLSGTDVAKKRRSVQLKDKHGILENISRRRVEALADSTFSGNPIYGLNSNVYIVSQRVMDEAETNLAGSFNDESTRNEVFRALNALVVMVVDTEIDFVTIYYRDSRYHNELPLRSLGKLGKGDGPDVNELIDALNSNAKPKF